MNKNIITLILLCSLGLSAIHISSVQTVDDSFNAKTEFVTGDQVWLKMIVYNDEEISYPSIRIINIYTYYTKYTSYEYAKNITCAGTTITEGINAGENKTIYAPCTVRATSATGEYYTTANLEVYQNEKWSHKGSLTKTWNLTSQQPWVGAYIKQITLNETNTQNKKFPISHKFKANITVHNFNPTNELIANVTFYEGIAYPNCPNLINITLPPNSNTSFITECTTVDYSPNYLYVNLHLGAESIAWDTRLTQSAIYVYVNPSAVCGDGKVGTTEICDGTNFTQIDGYTRTCQKNGYESGNLTCIMTGTYKCNSYTTSECIPYSTPKVEIKNIQTGMVSYLPNETVGIYVRVNNTGNVAFPVGSYVNVEFKDLNTNQVLYSENHTITTTLKPKDEFSKWVYFENGDYPLYYFKISGSFYNESKTLIQKTESNTYSPAAAGDLTCVNKTEGGLVSLNCTGSGNSRQLLTVPKQGGIFISLKTTPTKAMYFWEYGDEILIIDNPSGTTYFITLAFPVKEAPDLNVLLAAALVILLSAFVWEKHAQ